MTDQTVSVAIIMGSQSDWKVMKHAADTLDKFGVSNEARVLSAHRNADRLDAYIAGLADKDTKVVIGGAGMAAALPGVIAAKTQLPVLGVPMESKLDGLDSLMSISQMPAGIPVGTLAIGRSGAVNAALLAVAIMALSDPDLAEKLAKFRAEQADTPDIPEENP
jgi:5-(carboxyamino)imidazole ribonucleotide mutase